MARATMLENSRVRFELLSTGSIMLVDESDEHTVFVRREDLRALRDLIGPGEPVESEQVPDPRGAQVDQPAGPFLIRLDHEASAEWTPEGTLLVCDYEGDVERFPTSHLGELAVLLSREDNKTTDEDGKLYYARPNEDTVCLGWPDRQPCVILQTNAARLKLLRVVLDRLSTLDKDQPPPTAHTRMVPGHPDFLQVRKGSDCFDLRGESACRLMWSYILQQVYGYQAQSATEEAGVKVLETGMGVSRSGHGFRLQGRDSSILLSREEAQEVLRVIAEHYATEQQPEKTPKPGDPTYEGSTALIHGGITIHLHSDGTLDLTNLTGWVTRLSLSDLRRVLHVLWCEDRRAFPTEATSLSDKMAKLREVLK